MKLFETTMDSAAYKLEKIGLSLNLYKNKYIHRKGVMKLIRTFSEFMIEHDKYMQNQICDDLKDVEESVIDKIKLNYFRCKNPLDEINTEDKCFRLYNELGIFLEPTTYQIGLETVIDKSGEVIERPVFGVHVPLKHQLEIFFQIPRLYDQMLRYEEDLIKEHRETRIVSNIIQTPFWNAYKTKYQGLNIVPLFGFYDDFCAGNALGSYTDSKKFDGIYILLPSLPPHLKAKIKNIFLASVFYSKDREIKGNSGIFKEFIKDMKFLSQKGINIVHKGQNI